MMRACMLAFALIAGPALAQQAQPQPPADWAAAQSAPVLEEEGAPETLLGEWEFGRLCVVTPGEAKPDCAAPAAANQGLEINVDSLMAANAGEAGSEDLTCRRVTDLRQGPNGLPVRTWVTVCGDQMSPRQMEMGRTRNDIPAPGRGPRGGQ